MASYICIGIIEMIFLCLTVYQTQNITAFSREQLHCLLRMDDYCSTEDPLDEGAYDETAVDNGDQPSDALITRWLNLTTHDCAKSEVLRWKSDPEESPDARFEGIYLIYRDEILNNIIYGEFRLPNQFCQDQDNEAENALFLCINTLINEFGEERFDILTTALQLITLGEHEDNSPQAIYLQEIAQYVNSRSEFPYPYQYCINSNPDNQSSFTVGSSDYSEENSYSN